jgi:putative CocE/NonD family hydrolase
MFRTWIAGIVAIALFAPLASAQGIPATYIRDNYARSTHKIPMRDGVHLYTIVYSPKDATQKYPMLMMRTPYGIPPYEEDKYRNSLGPNRLFIREGYIFVYQDVRGCYMSEGKFDNMRPQLTKDAAARKANDIDESTDTFDTIDYLIKKVPNHNGKVGLYGISYPGFYTSAGMINAHPALKAASPQAPIADWFFDDFYHNGAFFLSHAYPFFARFGLPRPEPTKTRSPVINFPSDGYKFFMDIGPLKNVNKPGLLNNQVAFWNTIMEHPTYDSYWKDRNLLPHLKNVAPAVMTVGGWFDAEDLYGTFRTYDAIEKQNPGIFNVIVIGPWSHGGWAREGAAVSKLGNVSFGSSTNQFYQKDIELPFFNHFLKGTDENKLPEAYVFETGANQWRQYDHWPPKSVQPRTFFLSAAGRLDERGPGKTQAGADFDSFISDPHKPVPTCDRITFGMPQEYMTDDMRYASRRPDVLTYQTEVLKSDLTLAGPIQAEIHVSTTGTDADWIVKIVDVFGEDTLTPGAKELAGYQMHVRSEVIRGRYRDSFEKPAPFEPNQPAKIKLTLQDVLHTFKKGHRLMVQVHSSWFPLVDRNPQKYVPNIFFANEDDFIVATHRVYRSPELPSQIRVGVMPAAKK